MDRDETVTSPLELVTDPGHYEANHPELSADEGAPCGTWVIIKGTGTNRSCSNVRKNKNMATIEPTYQISLTERAATELRTLMAENQKADAALRVWVAGGGCSGLQYGMALDDQAPESDDIVLEHEGIKIFVDELSLRYMTGAVVDYVDDVLGGGFKIENPNAVKSCGCGSSFSAEDSAMDGLDTSKGGGCGSCGCH